MFIKRLQRRERLNFIAAAASRRRYQCSSRAGRHGISQEPSRPNYVISRRTSYTWTMRRRKWTLLSLRPAFENLQCCIAADRTLTCLEFISSMPRSWHSHQLQGDRESVLPVGCTQEISNARSPSSLLMIDILTFFNTCSLLWSIFTGMTVLSLEMHQKHLAAVLCKDPVWKSLYEQCFPMLLTR